VTQAALEWLRHEEADAMRATRMRAIACSNESFVEAGRSDGYRYAAQTLGEYDPHEVSTTTTAPTFKDPADLDINE
jgi:hypothetical protein